MIRAGLAERSGVESAPGAARQALRRVAPLHAGTESLRTPRWREPDSNPWSRVQTTPALGYSLLVTKSLSARGLGPPDLAISAGELPHAGAQTIDVWKTERAPVAEKSRQTWRQRVPHS
jgi:hypothetical protein